MNEQRFSKTVLCLREYLIFFPFFSSKMAVKSKGRENNLSTCHVIGGSL